MDSDIIFKVLKYRHVTIGQLLNAPNQLINHEDDDRSDQIEARIALIQSIVCGMRYQGESAGRCETLVLSVTILRSQ